MSTWNIAVIGATGQVGSALIKLLEKTHIQINTLYLLSSDNSEGDIVRFSGKNITVKNITEMDWSLCHFAFFTANSVVTEKYAAAASDQGCIVLDASGYFSEHATIPLVVPKINNSALSEYRNHNIISIASPIVCQLLRSIVPLTELEFLTHLHVTNFIPASFFGQKGVNELAGQAAKLLNGLPPDNSFFEKQLAFNALPIAFDKNDFYLSEKILTEQIRKITQNNPLLISLDSVVLPIFYGMSQSVCIASNNAIELEMAKFNDLGIELVTDTIPTPVTEITDMEHGNNKIKIGNVRHSYGHFEQVQFWSVADNIHYLGALMLLETLTILIDEYM